MFGDEGPQEGAMREVKPTVFLSVILVVHGDQAYLRECISSVLAHGGSEVELVAVDDASPDHGSEILDQLAARDRRLVIRRLDRRVTLGEARNAGLAAARGEYLWFAETTDLVPEGALEAVIERLRVARPDVLLLDHVRLPVLGEALPGRHRRLLAEAGSETFTVDERPAAAGMGWPVWDKIVRHDYIRARGLWFVPGRFGELPLMLPALLAAARIAALPRVAYARREPPNAADVPDVHGVETDAPAQYEKALRLVETFELPENRRELVAPELLRHLLEILRGLPEGMRPAFFAEISKVHRRHSSDDLKGRLLRLEAWSVRRADYSAFCAFEWLAAQRRAAPRALRALRSPHLPQRRSRSRSGRQDRPRLHKPVDPDLAVFAAYWYRGYACNPRAIYEKLRELLPGVHGVWVVNEKNVANVPAGVDFVVQGTSEYADVIARAKVLVNNVNFPNHVVKREGTIHVQTHHGTTLKTMGLDLRGAEIASKRMNFKALLARCARWDYSITPNAYSTVLCERIFPARYETLEVGYPRNDVLVNATEEDVERIRDELGIGPRQAVLYAPTHREYSDGHLPLLDVRRFAETLGPDWVVLVRLHYFSDPDLLAAVEGSSHIVDVSRHPSVEALYLAADVLLTDYSSAMFDYGVLDRPIVIHAPDWEEYQARRGTYFDLLAEPPGAVGRTDAEVAEALRGGAAWGEGASQAREAFRRRFCSIDDGHAAERVVRTVWLGERDTPPVRRASHLTGVGA